VGVAEKGSRGGVQRKVKGVQSVGPLCLDRRDSSCLPFCPGEKYGKSRLEGEKSAKEEGKKFRTERGVLRVSQEG
jgi:hypothetical protein